MFGKYAAMKNLSMQSLVFEKLRSKVEDSVKLARNSVPEKLIILELGRQRFFKFGFNR